MKIAGGHDGSMSMNPRAFLSLCVLLLWPASAAPAIVRCRVVDEHRRPVVAARVTAGENSTATSADGKFSVDLTEPSTPVQISAPGFATVVTTVSEGQEIVLVQQRTFGEEVTVTAVPRATRLANTPASIVIISAEQLGTTASQAIDDALRQVPGFSLFRRSGSRVANPTAQGVSLRGIGPSGASRAVVLDDGVPLNDPFGGWVQWLRVPLLVPGRIEIFRGAASDAYGSGAISGVINLLPRDDRDVTAIDTSWGSQSTPQFSAYTALSGGPWRASISGDWSKTDGYVSVPVAARGAVDTPLAWSHRSVAVRGDRAGDSSHLFARVSYFDEQRDNGTPLQENATTIRSGSIGADIGAFTVRLYGSDQSYRQTFSSVADDRSSERLTRVQSVPANSIGGSLHYARASGSRNYASAGIEMRTVAGRSNEVAIVPDATSRTVAGGRQQSAAIFLHDDLQLSTALSLTASIRAERWENIDAFRIAAGSKSTLRSRSETAVNPRLALNYQLAPSWSLSTSFYRGFRAPTLNELYRSFRVGNVLTLANEDLVAERVRGFELGTVASSARSSLRVNLFVMELSDPVANVTLSVAPSLITRQRENLGSTRTRGVEVDFESHLTGWLSVAGGYLFTDSRVTSFAANTALEGLRVAQVPRHQISMQARGAVSSGSVALQARWSDSQFEDDLNRTRLRSYFTADAIATVPLGSSVSAYAAVENMFDEQYEIGRTPVVTLGPPRSFRAGLRLTTR